ncbi:hypothetical protein C9374_000948 [Naegleria lovaniensis]|uniref:Uncharacterized protein n=1 Tax=Naegleria lovaniensis TaxID=51637 RepID=A0AA88GXC0_NAELO|nr:uncharacterized protein C9374_000948 [Naegleria lovaniensis]KAG2388098.1 hypothetical protein C9374_000948 [Naegleria lovaniensis]
MSENASARLYRHSVRRRWIGYYEISSYSILLMSLYFYYNNYQQEGSLNGLFVEGSELQQTYLTTTSANPSSSISNYNIADFLLDIGMVFGPTIGYIDQIRIMMRDKSSNGFSRLSCLILLSSSLLRVYFWYLKQFSIVMLFQSLVMILCQAILLFVAVHFGKQEKKAEEKNANRDTSLLVEPENPNDFTYLIKIDRNRFLEEFWQWDEPSYYVWTVLFFMLFVGIVSLFFYPIFPVAYTELLGLLSVMVEASLAIPQVVTNFTRGSVEGLSLILVATFVIGDTLKTAYFIAKHLPYQFVICGAFQLFVDMIMVIQIIYYNVISSGNRMTESSSNDSQHEISESSAIISEATASDQEEDDEADLEQGAIVSDKVDEPKGNSEISISPESVELKSIGN